MPVVNLKVLYPKQYKKNRFIKVNEKVYEALLEFERHEKAAERQVQRYKAYYRFDTGYGIPWNALSISEKEAFIDSTTGISLDMFAALNQLPELQKKRIYMHIVLGLSVDTIAKDENLHPQAVYKSIHRGLSRLKKYFSEGV